MSILSALSSKKETKKVSSSLKDFLENFSIEVMPRTASKIENFNEILPQNTRVYIAHIEGVPIDEMVQTAKRISSEGFDVMPHFHFSLNRLVIRIEGDIHLPSSSFLIVITCRGVIDSGNSQRIR